MSAAIDLDALTREQQVELLAQLLSRLIAPAPVETSAALLSAKQVAERWSVPESWVLERHRAGHLRGQRLGKYIRFSEDALDEYLCSDDAKGLTAPPRSIGRARALHNPASGVNK